MGLTKNGVAKERVADSAKVSGARKEASWVRGARKGSREAAQGLGDVAQKARADVEER